MQKHLLIAVQNQYNHDVVFLVSGENQEVYLSVSYPHLLHIEEYNFTSIL